MRLWVLGAVTAMIGFAPAQSETLQEAIEAAYRNNPDLAAQRKEAADAQEQLAQARGERRPTVTVSGSVGYETITSNNPFAQGLGSHPISEAQIAAELPIYTGGRISAGIDQAKAGISAANAELEGASQNIILDVVSAYVSVQRDREAIRIRENSVTLLQEQLRAASDRFEVGVVTRTDVAQAEARLSGAQASLAGAEADLQASQANYAFLVGAPAGELVPVPALPELPIDLEEAVMMAFRQSPDLEAARYNEKAAEQQIEVAKGALRPSVSIVGTAGIQETYEYEFEETSQTIVAQASIPLFEGGISRSQVRSAKLQRDRAKLLRSSVERQIRAEVTRAWFANVAANRAIEASVQQVRAAEIAYDGAQEELSVGLRTTLDVLDQEQQLLDARLSVIDAERDAYIAAHQLLRALGELQIENFDPNAEVYDPSAYGDKVRRNWLLTDAE